MTCVVALSRLTNGTNLAGLAGEHVAPQTDVMSQGTRIGLPRPLKALI